MIQGSIEVLLIEDNPGDARLVQSMLANGAGSRYGLHHVERVSTALQQLVSEDFDVILLDLSLPDAFGLESVEKVHAASPEIPIVILTALGEEPLSVQALRVGAQDYLVKRRLTEDLLLRAIEYAIERHRLQINLRNLALTDELTGLHNRRGFLSLAEQQLRLSPRMNADLLLLFMDVDDLKGINDSYGHREGDRALNDVAQIISNTFRDSDIVARLGGDEFVVLAIGLSEAKAGELTSRLSGNLEAFNDAQNRKYKLSMSFGVSRYDRESKDTIEELLDRADQDMNAIKRLKRMA